MYAEALFRQSESRSDLTEAFLSLVLSMASQLTLAILGHFYS